MAKNNPLYTDEVLFALVLYNRKCRAVVVHLLAQYEQSRKFAEVSELDFGIHWLKAMLDYRGGALPRSDDIASAVGISNANGTVFKKSLVERIFVLIDEEKILIPVDE